MPPRAATLPLLIVSGAWAEARELASITRAEGSPLERQMAITTLGQLLRHQGEPDSAWEMVKEILPRGPASQPEDALLPYATESLRTATKLSLDAGDPDQAAEWLATHDNWLEWSGAMRGRAESAALKSEILRATGKLDDAAQSARQAVELASDPRQPLALIEAHRTLGIILIQQGESAEAEQHLCCAYDLSHDCASPFEQATSEVALAEFAMNHNPGPHNPKKLLDEARQRAEALGAAPLLQKCAELASRPGQDREPGTLTLREIEVLRMVSQGLTDAEAAERLFISPRTVSQHMRSVYNKLGVSSRAAATRWAVQHEII